MRTFSTPWLASTWDPETHLSQVARRAACHRVIGWRPSLPKKLMGGPNRGRSRCNRVQARWSSRSLPRYPQAAVTSRRVRDS